jgi:hypothetical protein
MFRSMMMAATVAGLLAATPVMAAEGMTKDAYKAEKERIENDFKTDKAACKDMKANAKDVCMAEAKAKQKVAKAEAEANYKNTSKARTQARVAKVDADYSVAKEKCDDLSGNAKDACVREAKTARNRAKSEAKANRSKVS